MAVLNTAKSDWLVMLIAMKAHSFLGQNNMDATLATAKHLGWKLVWGIHGICVTCDATKAKKMTVDKGKGKLA